MMWLFPRGALKVWWLAPAVAYVAGLAAGAVSGAPGTLLLVVGQFVIVPWALIRWRQSPGFGKPRQPFRFGWIGVLGAVVLLLASLLYFLNILRAVFEGESPFALLVYLGMFLVFFVPAIVLLRRKPPPAASDAVGSNYSVDPSGPREVNSSDPGEP